MKKPEAIIQLLEDLHSEVINSSVETIAESKAVVYLDDEAATAEDGIRLSRQECLLLFSTVRSVDRFMEALGDPGEASIALFELGLTPEVLDRLERRFIAVDEG